jgi:hypothetical protein
MVRADSRPAAQSAAPGLRTPGFGPTYQEQLNSEIGVLTIQR